MDKNEREGGRWLAQARHDVRAASVSRENGFPEVACFLAQQSAEKALKAFLYAQGERPVLGHATHILVQRCAEYRASFLSLLDGCRRLDQFYIATRYPSGIPDGIPHDVFTDDQACEAVATAGQIIATVAQHLDEGRVPSQM
ncbi:MAG: HEPN domain-containing protein [Anaerolineae bacterium]